MGINKYKEDNPIPKTEPNPAPANPQNNNADSELLKRLETMEKELADSKREKQQADIRKNIISALKEKGVKDEEWVNDLLSEITIADDFNIDSKVDSYVKLYNKSQAGVNANATPQSTEGKTSEKRISDVIDSAAALAKADRI